MLYEISFLWAWLVVAMMIGCVAGWAAKPVGLRGGGSLGWAAPALIGLAIGLVAAWLHWLPGRAGFWLDTGLLFLASYGVGCVVGGYLKGRLTARPTALARS